LTPIVRVDARQIDVEVNRITYRCATDFINMCGQQMIRFTLGTRY
jgi:hypothetical protein